MAVTKQAEITGAPDTVSGPIRIVTATSLFDGHDAAINVMRRVLQDLGAEIIHLGHNRSVQEIVQAAIQEDAQAIAVSSYQGGHIEFFKYMVALLNDLGAGHIKVFGGGGGVIVPREIRELEACGVEKIYSPEDGRRMGLVGMLQDLIARCATDPAAMGERESTSSLRASSRSNPLPAGMTALHPLTADLQDPLHVAQLLTALETASGTSAEAALQLLHEIMPSDAKASPPVIGFTGTGGAGKSSLVDELVSRFLRDFQDKRVAILSIDPTRRRTGGALLGDRIRMNAVSNARVYMRSLATRGRGGEMSGAVPACVAALKRAGFDLILVETAGIGQGDAGIVPHVDISVYVMTAEFGAASQLEKIDMIDFADIVAINKFDRAGSEDALRDVRKQFQRNRHAWNTAPDELPVYGTIAARFNDDGVTALYHGIIARVNELMDLAWTSRLPAEARRFSSAASVPIAPNRIRYLQEIAETIRRYHAWAQGQAQVARDLWHLTEAHNLVTDEAAKKALQDALDSVHARADILATKLLAKFRLDVMEEYKRNEYVYHVRGKEIRTPLFRETLAGTRIPRVALPRFEDPGEQLRWLLLENVPGSFPFTAGVFPFKRSDEAAARMFAGEGDAARTNARFKYLSRNSDAKRLSTAFDSVTLYGNDPNERPDIYGKVGSSGVSICTLEDMKILYGGFDLTAPNTSVSMTINGPAPIILAMFFNAAIDQQIEQFEQAQSRQATPEECTSIAEDALKKVRGTVQADILKEDQGQNTCIFAIDFALKMQGDIQEYFIAHGVRNFYSVSISGYHIAEAGANPISQLAFTLANGFTFVEHYLTRGMDINAFAQNLSFFFSCGMDIEYAVLNRVARRIWAIAMRDRYGANARAQQLKTHIQTSGRSLHAQEVDFNDIRTTLEALSALYDQCNSLHTNAYDEAVTTPTENSVRRAQAIQLIIDKEHGMSMNENPLQGSFIIEELTDLVEEAVLKEFERLSDRGGVLGAMERGYQRGRIQDDSHRYEQLKSSGAYPIVGVNTFVNAGVDHEAAVEALELRRGTNEEKESQLARLRSFQAAHAHEAPTALARLKQVCCENGNVFDELMRTVRSCSLGQITAALYEVGGQYRRNT